MEIESNRLHGGSSIGDGKRTIIKGLKIMSGEKVLFSRIFIKPISIEIFNPEIIDNKPSQKEEEMIESCKPHDDDDDDDEDDDIKKPKKKKFISMEVKEEDFLIEEQVKFEAASTKLRESYGRINNAKKRKMIQIIPFQHPPEVPLPKPKRTIYRR